MSESALVPTTLDLLANIEDPMVYPPSEYPGVKFVATDAPKTFTSNGTVLIPEGGGGGGGGALTLVPNVYLDSVTGNDSNNGLTPATPWKTWAPIIAMLAAGSQPQMVNFDVDTPAGGSYPIPDASPEAHFLAQIFFRPTGLPFNVYGPDVGLKGVWKDAGFGTLTVLGVANLTVNNIAVTQLTVAGAPFPITHGGVNGYRIRMTTGAAAGTKSTIGSAKPAANAVQTAFGTIGASPGDQFVIEQAATLVTYTGTLAGGVGFDMSGGTMILDGVLCHVANAPSEPDFYLSNGLFIVAGMELSALVTAVPYVVGRLRVNNASLGAYGYLATQGLLIPTTYPIQVDFNEGLFFHDTATSLGGIFWYQGDAPAAFFLQCVGVNASLGVFGMDGGTGFIAWMHLPDVGAGAVVDFDSSLNIGEGTVAIGYSEIAIFPGGTIPGSGIQASGQATTVNLAAYEVGTPYPAGGKIGVAGLLINQGARVQAENLTGTAAGIGGVGVQLARGGQLDCDDASVGSTMTGTGGDVIVGDNPVATWVNIATRVTGVVTDIGAAQTQFCAITQ